MKPIVLGFAILVAFDLLATALIGSAEVQVAQNQNTRIDTYDKHSNRTGYAVVDPRTGRIDFFDKYSNRTGSGQITPPPQPVQPPAPSTPTSSSPCSRPPCR